MDNEIEKDSGDSSMEDSAETLKDLEYLKYQMSGLHGNREISAKPLPNPATVAEIYRIAMKKPGEILASQLNENE